MPVLEGPQRVWSISCQGYEVALPLQQAARDLQVDLIVVTHQDALACWSRHLGSTGSRGARRLHQLQGHLEGEGRALARPAVHVQLPMHQLHQALGDGQPQARSTEATSGGALRLGVGGAEPLLLLHSNPESSNT